jgi:hypothetical protein
MVKQLTGLWRRLSRLLAADPGRFAGGSAAAAPLGLLAAEEEELARRRPSRCAAGPADGRR